MSRDIDCPRAKSYMTPCIARDGNTALADDGKCVGCWVYPFEELSRVSELLGRRVGYWAYSGRKGRDKAADDLRDLVAEYVESKERTSGDE